MAKLLHKAIGLGGQGTAGQAAYDAYTQHFRQAPVHVLRDMLELKSELKPIPVEEVEPAAGEERVCLRGWAHAWQLPAPQRRCMVTYKRSCLVGVGASAPAAASTLGSTAALAPLISLLARHHGALLHRRHVAGRHQPRDARDDRHCGQPHRRQVQLR